MGRQKEGIIFYPEWGCNTRAQRLLKHEFEPEVELDNRRHELSLIGDKIFERVMAAMGPAKKVALREFNKHNYAVRSFLEKNKWYFTKKKTYLLENVSINFGGRAPMSACELGEDVSLRKGKGARAMALLAGMFLIFQGCALAQVPSSKAVLSIVGEAEGEGAEGMLAVADAIRNRESLKGVYGLRSYRVRHHLYSNYILHQAEVMWLLSKHKDITNGATGWGSDEDLNKFCGESWWAHCVLTARVGNQWFYKEIK